MEALGALGALGALLSSGNASALITGLTNTHKLHLEACLHGSSLTIGILEIDYIRTPPPPTLDCFHRHTPEEIILINFLVFKVFFLFVSRFCRISECVE